MVVTLLRETCLLSLVRNPNKSDCESIFNVGEEWKQRVSAYISTSTPQNQATAKGRASHGTLKGPRKTSEDVKKIKSETPKKENKKFNPVTPNGPTMLDKWVRKETRSENETKPVVTAEPAITSDNRKLPHPEKSDRTSQISPSAGKDPKFRYTFNRTGSNQIATYHNFKFSN